MKKISIGLCMLSAIVLAGCGMQTTTKTTDGPVTVKVGVIAPLSGPAASFGEDAINTYTMAAESFNSSQSDYKVEIIAEDSKCDGQNATAATQKLVNIDGVKIIIGGVCSSETLAAAKIAVPAGVVVLSPTASSPEISKEKDRVYRLYNDMAQSATIADYFTKNNMGKIALIYENTDYGVGLAKALKEKMGDNVVIEQNYNSEEKDFSILAKNIATKKANIQGIVYIPQSDATSINILKALEGEGLTSQFKGKILTSEAGISAAVLKEGSRIEDLLSTQLPTASKLGSEAESLLEQFKAKHEVKVGDTFIILFREVFDVVTAGITDKDFGVEKLNEYIKSISQDHPRTGLFGSYYFNGADAIGLNFVVKQVKNAALTDME